MNNESLTRVEQVDGFEVFEGEGQRWIRDIDLAVNAGLSQPRTIRSKSIATAIRDGAILPVNNGDAGGIAVEDPCFYEVVETFESGNNKRETTKAYYLNHEAALVVIQRMRTPKAVALQKAMARVFRIVASGELSGRDLSGSEYVREIAANTSVLRELCAKLVVGQLESDKKIDRVADKVDNALERVEKLENQVSAGFNSIIKRNAPSTATIQEHLDVCLAHYGGRCICCRTTLIVNPDGSKTSQYTTEHFVRRDKNGPDETAPVCRECNLIELEKPGMRAEYSATFAEYQRLRRNYTGPLFQRRAS